jgi:uncharacterized protein (DUF2062 family)
MGFLKKYLQKIITYSRELVKQGYSKQKLSLGLVLGIFFGIIPILGVTTVLLLMFARLFKLNIIITQLVNYAVYPLQLLLYIPFLKTAAYITGYQLDMSLSSTAIHKLSIIDLVEQLGVLHGYAVALWAFISVPAALLFYRIFLFTFRDNNISLVKTRLVCLKRLLFH